MELFIERLSWTEVEAALEAGKRRAVVCAASTEQHGPHLPEATDALLGEAYARGLAERLGDALVAPIIRPACSEHHMAFAGSLTIPETLLMDLLDAYLASLRRHGFERFVVMSPYAPQSPFEVWIVPRQHHCAYEDALTASSVPELAALLSRYFRTLAGPLGDPSFEMTLYTAPNVAAKVLPGEWATIAEDYHWHLEVVPSQPRARIGGIYVNEIAPEEAASRLRDAWST